MNDNVKFCIVHACAEVNKCIFPAVQLGINVSYVGSYLICLALLDVNGDK